MLVEALFGEDAELQGSGEGAQQRLAAVPVVERRLEGRRDGVGLDVPREVAGNDDEPPVAAAFEGGEFQV